MVYIELTTLSKDGRVQLFFYYVCSLFVNNPFCSIFFNHSKKLITFVLKNIVHFPSIISFIFSVNDCLVKSLALIGHYDHYLKVCR